MQKISPVLRAAMLATDVGFVAYWAATFLHVVPRAWLYRDYTDAAMVAWNQSFLPIDLFASATGFGAVLAAHRHDVGRVLAIVSLTLTSASGLMAISFWTLRGDFDALWWAPNLLLMVYPLVFLPALARTAPSSVRWNQTDARS